MHRILKRGLTEKCGSLPKIWGSIRVAGEGNNVKWTTKYIAILLKMIKLNSLKVMCMYKDELGRIWAGTEGCGLSLYDSKIG